MRSLAIETHDHGIGVAEHPSARDVAVPSLPLHRVVRPLPGLLALELVGEAGKLHHDLLDRRIQRSFAILEVEEHPRAGLNQLLQREAGLDALAAEPRLLGHHEHLERRPRLQRIHMTKKPGTVREFGAADAVIDVDVLPEPMVRGENRSCSHQR